MPGSDETHRSYEFSVRCRECGKISIQKDKLLDPEDTLKRICGQGCECGDEGILDLVGITGRE